VMANTLHTPFEHHLNTSLNLWSLVRMLPLGRLARMNLRLRLRDEAGGLFSY
jgi:hypothetical protein